MKLSSSLKLRNFDIDTKMIAVAPHHLIYTYLYRSGYCQFGVGYCFIRVKGNAKARVWDKADIVPTPYFILTASLWGLIGRRIYDMMMKKHLHHSLRALLLSCLVLLSQPMFAAVVENDGINYELDAETKQATVVATKYSYYSGDIIIPESVEHNGTIYCVTSIGDEAFYQDNRMTSVYIPNSVTSIGKKAFFRCDGLTSVYIPNSVTSIGEDIFRQCAGLESVTIGNSVTSISDYAFAFCHKLRTVTIGNKVTSIGKDAFCDCDGLTSVSIPNSVTSIGDFAFDSCSGLISISIPNSVTSIGEDAFYNCRKLTSVHVTDIAAWCKIEFKNHNSNPFYYARHFYLNEEEIKDLIIPNSVTSIRNFAFYNCNGLTSVSIPNSVTSIGEIAFAGCKGLTSISIPNSVTNIGDYAFGNCSGLISVLISNGVSSIGQHAFNVCSRLTSVTIPNSVTSIGEDAF